MSSVSVKMIHQMNCKPIFIIEFSVELSANENIKVRPAKVVAGLEADKTNEFLQAIGKAIERKIDSTEAVAAVKNGTTAELTKPAKPAAKSKAAKSKELAPAGTSTKKSSIDSNKKAEIKTKGGGKGDAKNSTEIKKSKPNVSKKNSVSKEVGQSKSKEAEAPVNREEKVSVEPVEELKDDEKEELAVSR